MLIQGLKELEKDGVVSRRDFREIPPKVEYSLTERGVELANVLRPLCEWGRENFSEQIAPPQPESYATARNRGKLAGAPVYIS
jgi:DNA-binding HxlR family transcriptional regulator